MVVSFAAVSDERPYDWTGGYVGANLGVAWSASALNANHANFVGASDRYATSLNSTDVNPGFQFGYLKSLDSDWVVGGEADFTYPASNATSTHEVCNCSRDIFHVRNNLQGSLRLRAGHAFDRFLPYVTTGVSFGSLGLYYDNDQGNSYSQRTVQTGWVLGGGLEYGVLENLSARLEYLYTSYGSSPLNMAIPTIDGVTDPSGAAHATMNVNVLRAAVNWRF